MALREYELMYIVRPTVAEDALPASIERVDSIISGLGGEVAENNPWGKRRLAYPIEKFEEDLYGVEATPCGWRRATVTFGGPIDVKPFLTGKSRTAATELTARLESELQRLMSVQTADACR